MVSLISENLLCHPFVVLRRQCQVHHNSKRFHLVPITLMPVVYHIQRRQGIATLWKGIGGTFLIRAMSLGVEDLISKVTPWPKELTPLTTKKQFVQHLFLKWYLSHIAARDALLILNHIILQHQLCCRYALQQRVPCGNGPE